jgi:hypothetical protein
MYVRENLCVWVFFLKKSVKVFDKSKLKFYLCRRNKVLKIIEKIGGRCVEVSNPSGFIRSSGGRAYVH